MAASQPQGCLAAIFRLLGIKPNAQPAPNHEFPFRVRADFLSPAELSFYHVLQRAMNGQAIVCPKVNLADIFFVANSDQKQSHRNKIDRKHVDFLVCDPNTLQPLLGVELDDASHQRQNRIERDEFVNQVFAAAGLRLVRFPARASYDPNTVAVELTPYLAPLAIATTPSPGNSQATPICPKCNVPMVQRVASKGKNAGKQFWGCSNYPKCREVV